MPPKEPLRLEERSATFRAALSGMTWALWAKSGDDTGFMPLPQHLLDAAFAAEWLWENWVSKAVKNTLVKLTGLDLDALKTVAIWCCGVHDLGKATITFVRQIENKEDGAPIVNNIVTAGLPLRAAPAELALQKFPHARASRAIISRWLIE